MDRKISGKNIRKLARVGKASLLLTNFARSGFGIGPERKLLILILAKAKSGRQEARQGISVED